MFYLIYFISLLYFAEGSKECTEFGICLDGSKFYLAFFYKNDCKRSQLIDKALEKMNDLSIELDIFKIDYDFSFNVPKNYEIKKIEYVDDSIWKIRYNLKKSGELVYIKDGFNYKLPIIDSYEKLYDKFGDKVVKYFTLEMMRWIMYINYFKVDELNGDELKNLSIETVNFVAQGSADFKEAFSEVCRNMLADFKCSVFDNNTVNRVDVYHPYLVDPLMIYQLKPENTTIDKKMKGDLRERMWQNHMPIFSQPNILDLSSFLETSVKKPFLWFYKRYIRDMRHLVSTLHDKIFIFDINYDKKLEMNLDNDVELIISDVVEYFESSRNMFRYFYSGKLLDSFKTTYLFSTNGVVLTNLNGKGRFIYEGDLTSDDAIIDWVSIIFNGKAKKLLVSEKIEKDKEYLKEFNISRISVSDLLGPFLAQTDNEYVLIAPTMKCKKEICDNIFLISSEYAKINNIKTFDDFKNSCLKFIILDPYTNEIPENWFLSNNIEIPIFFLKPHEDLKNVDELPYKKFTESDLQDYKNFNIFLKRHSKCNRIKSEEL